MSSSVLTWVAVMGVSIGLFSCGARLPEPAEPAEPDAVAPTPPVAAEAAESELFRRLSAVQAPSDLLAGLPPALVEGLAAQVAQLTPEQTELLLRGEDPVVALRPLLYVAAGGREPSNVAWLYSSPSAAQELVTLATQLEADVDLVAAAASLAESGARFVLHSRATDLAVGVEHRREHLEQVAFAASVLSRPDIERLTLLELEQLEPDPRWSLALLRLSAKALELDAARARLKGLEGLPEDVVRQAQAELDTAERLVSAKPPEQLDEAVAQARDWMSLGRIERALETLAPFAEQRRSHLALAGAWARAQTEASACPRLRGAAASDEHLCRRVWAQLLEDKPLDYLHAAYDSGQGRDIKAIETYIGLAYVVPQMYGLDARGKPADLDFVQTAFSRIDEVARQSAELAPHFEGVALIARALGAVFAATTNEQQRAQSLSPETRKTLMDAAMALGRKQPAEPWTQAAVLAVATMVSREERLQSVLEPIMPTISRRYETTLGTLLLWDVLADADVARFEQLSQLLGEVATNQDASSFERSRWLFLWAEAEAHLKHDEQAHATLAKIAQNLDDARVPLGLRLRARLDLAGLKARSGDLAGASALLDEIVAQTPRNAVSSHDEQELLVAASAYAIVIAALQVKGEERQQLAQKLSDLLENVTRARAAPPTLEAWMLLWRAELDYLMAHDGCSGRASCEQAARKLRGVRDGALEQAIGARSASLLRHGVVPVGGVQIEFRYFGRGTLAPRLEVMPRFLMAHVPPL